MRKNKIPSMKEDVIFKHIFETCKVPNRLASFLNAVTGIEIKSIKILQSKSVPPKNPYGKVGILDNRKVIPKK